MRNTQLIKKLENQINELEIKKAELEEQIHEADKFVYSDMADLRNNFVIDFIYKHSEDLSDFGVDMCLESTDYLDSDGVLYVTGYYHDVEEITREELSCIAYDCNVVDCPDGTVIVEQPSYDWLEFYENIIIGDTKYYDTKIRFVTNRSYKIVEEESEECEDCED